MSIKQELRDLADGLATLLFPRLCLNCRQSVTRGQPLQLCVPCYSDLAETGHQDLPENELTDRLAGRLPIACGAALLYFNTGTVCQQLIHALKYHQRPDIGRELGKRLGERLLEHPALRDLDGIVPVPIHADRRHQRGYNQAEEIGLGLVQVLGKPMYPDALYRRHFKGSQTKKNRFERVENTRESFMIGKGDFAGKHLLLVDDVLTTGATIDFCGNILLDHHPGIRISVATLAIAGG